MVTDATLKKFFDALTRDEALFVERLNDDAIGVYLRSVVSELDWYYYNVTKRPEEVELEQQEHLYILRLGTARLIRNALASRESFIAPALSLVRTPESAKKTLEIASAFGMIDHGRRLGQLVSAGLCSIEEAETDHFVFKLPPLVPDHEFYERAVADHYNEQQRRHLDEAWKNSPTWNGDTQDEVDRLLTELVRPWGPWIGYDADVLLDQYFYLRAFTQLGLYEGYDTYNYAVRFGGISIDAYFTALTYVLSLALKHIAFAEALIKKAPEIKLENVLTISSESRAFVEHLRDAVNLFGGISPDFIEIDTESAEQIFRVLSVGRDNLALLDRPGCPIPLLVRNTDSGVIKCLTGTISNPVLFLLESLRFHFPDDYNRNQQLREKSFQRAIERALKDFGCGVLFRENIKVKVDGKVRTDIDIAVVDEATGVTLLCQLKHQELYGDDLHSRWMRCERLKDQAASWFTTVDAWLGKMGEDGLRSSLQVPRSVPQLKVRKVIISRHYASPVRDVLPDEWCGYATWMQFVNALYQIERRMPPDERCLDEVFAVLKSNEAPGGTQHQRVPPDTTWHLPRVRFSTLQEPPGQESSDPQTATPR